MLNAMSTLLAVALTASGIQPLQPTPWAQKLFHGVTEHDFGYVPRSTMLTHRIPMKNIYAVPLELINIRAGG